MSFLDFHHLVELPELVIRILMEAYCRKFVGHCWNSWETKKKEVVTYRRKKVTKKVPKSLIFYTKCFEAHTC